MANVNDLPFDETPLRTDPLIGIANHDSPTTWAVRRMQVSKLLALIIDGDLPATIARLSDLTSFLTAASIGTLSNKTFSDRTNFTVGIALAGVDLTGTATQLNALVGHLTKLNAILATSDEINILSGLLTATSELNALAGIGLSSTELSILKGAILTTAELNTLSGILSTVIELNKLSGFTGTTADLNNLVSLLTSLNITQLKTVCMTQGYSIPIATTPKVISLYIPASEAGTIERITVSINDALSSTNSLTIQPSISAVNITQGLITITGAQSAGHAAFSAPTAEKTVTLGQIIRFVFTLVDIAGTPALSGTLNIHIQRP